MDFQEIISIVFFIAYIVYRYFLKGKSEDTTANKPKRRQRPSREETAPQNTTPDNKKPSPFEEIFKELEKEFGGEEVQKETKSEPTPAYETTKAERDFLKEQEEMQRVAETEYGQAASKEAQTQFPNAIGKRKKTRKKKGTFDSRKAYMYKELLDRKHFEV